MDKIDCPLISVIVPVYNVERFLSRCIDSILAQKYKNFELLLINDGSKDASGHMCDLYAEVDARIKVFHKENGGVSSARNLGLEKAKGEWITFCDSDDYVKDFWLDNFIKNIDATTDFVCQGYEASSAISGKHSIGINADANAESILDNITHNDLLGYVCTKLFKKNIIERSGIIFNERIRFREDCFFVIQYLSKIENKAKCIDSPGYIYCEIPNYESKYEDNGDMLEGYIDEVKKAIINKNSLACNYSLRLCVELVIDSYYKMKSYRYQYLKDYRRCLMEVVSNNIVITDRRNQILKYLLKYIILVPVTNILLEINTKINHN